MTVNPKLKDTETDHLFKAILQLRTIEECYMFFEDVCTITELKALAQRFQVARMLRRGKTYNEIVEATGASSATISRVNRCINYGADGYNLILDRLEKGYDAGGEYKPE
ncbi:MAG: His repressor [Firmicutes bacterium]|nr:His repressor [Bacillota bacterium]MDI6706172.1 YerC/YecD family TrpR-related protein [Bacillota bacterium]